VKGFANLSVGLTTILNMKIHAVNANRTFFAAQESGWCFRLAFTRESI